jgi:hypothetical protein
MLELVPTIALGAGVHPDAVTDLLGDAQEREPQQAGGVAPAVHAAAHEVTHRHRSPTHSIAEAQLLEQLEGRRVGLADEVVEALDREPGEVEVRGHAAGLGRRLDDRGLVAIAHGLVGGGEAHHPGADDDTRHD